MPKLTLVPYARLTSLPGADVSGVLDLLQAQSITKASAATTAAENLIAATDTGFEIRDTLDGVIKPQLGREPGQVNSFKSQQATTMQLTLVRPNMKDSIVPLSGELLIYFPADRANMRTFRTWKLRFAARFGGFVIVPTLSTENQLSEKLTRADLQEQLAEDHQTSFGFQQNCEVAEQIHHETPPVRQIARIGAADLLVRQIG